MKQWVRSKNNCNCSQGSDRVQPKHLPFSSLAVHSDLHKDSNVYRMVEGKGSHELETLAQWAWVPLRDKISKQKDLHQVCHRRELLQQYFFLCSLWTSLSLELDGNIEAQCKSWSCTTTIHKRTEAPMSLYSQSVSEYTVRSTVWSNHVLHDAQL